MYEFTIYVALPLLILSTLGLVYAFYQILITEQDTVYKMAIRKKRKKTPTINKLLHKLKIFLPKNYREAIMIDLFEMNNSMRQEGYSIIWRMFMMIVVSSVTAINLIWFTVTGLFSGSENKNPKSH